MRKFLLVLVLLLFSTSFCYQFYFANLHAHTAYSDGVGTPEEAFEHARRYVHVQAITDHAEYFGQKIDGQDKLLLTKAAAKRATTKDFVALWGFEWTGGVGHINVYCTDEWIDRTRSLKELYEWIVKKRVLAQFNHPIATFGTFYDFEYDPKADEFINLIEVGNGSWRGRIISDEMFSNYVLALKKGWHLGATAGQDNHKGGWGSANDARTVILADELGLESILTALMERRTYASEDKSAKLWFSCGQSVMGSIVETSEAVSFEICYEDDEPLERLYLISESGTVTEWTVNSNHFEAIVDVTPPDANEWYFLYAVQKDGDRIVSSPIWVRASKIYPVNVRFSSSPRTLNLSFDLVNFSDAASNVEVKIVVADRTEELRVFLQPKTKVVVNRSYTDLTPGSAEIRIELAGLIGWKGRAEVLRDSILLDVSHENGESRLTGWLNEACKRFGIVVEKNTTYFKKVPKNRLIVLPLPKKESFPETRQLNDFEIENILRHLEAGGRVVLISYDGAVVDESFVKLVKAIDPDLNLSQTEDRIFLEVRGKEMNYYVSDGFIFAKVNSLQDAIELLEELLR
ncbi:CehA/McbA family metallohydrolase [Thermotoga caldifontis]|uniref:CehA/McbA family metallohydrolase n=1 Tax=Thermotoga caldifontis TaxID=1508419 RepID=UPI0006948328|nr:CehA/McbA family metallohydrolase [Thermotoga caldifontis]